MGHAIEAATGYTRYRHGEAVAIGLLVALRLSGRDQLRDEVAELLGARGLPLGRFTGASVDDVLALVERDKKRAGGRVPFVLVRSARRGDAPATTWTPAALRAAVEEVHSAMRHRIEVMHGVNFDVLGARRRRALRRHHAHRARGEDQAVRPRARDGAELLADEPRG